MVVVVVIIVVAVVALIVVTVAAEMVLDVIIVTCRCRCCGLSPTKWQLENVSTSHKCQITYQGWPVSQGVALALLQGCTIHRQNTR